jgi:transcriptional regulator with XRE-family HTH domain
LSILGQKSGFMTCRERAEAAGISIHTLRHLERGSFLPGPEIIDMLAKAYDRPVAEIERACGLTRENLLRKELERARYIR